MHNGIEVQCYAWNGDGEVVSDMVTLTVIKDQNAGQPDHMPEVSDFTDVPANAWYYNDVANAVEMGLINGTVNWYDIYVEYAEKNGIIYRDEWDEAYNKKATRQEFVTIFYKALPHTEYPEINDIDANAIPDVPMDIGYASVVYGFYRAGILTGSDANGTFYPNRNIQRSEVATIISRMMDKSARKFIVLPAIDLGLMKGPMCWISGNKYVFITEREGKAAVQFGYWESPYYPTRPVAFVSAVGVNGNFMDIDLYYPPLSGDNAADSQDLQPCYETIHIDMEYLDVDGKVKMRWNNETEWSHYYPAGPTWQDGYNEVH
ncbi:MAG: S-layer homology domain-containing protein [Clostridia bacterium]|nr:S-layer homology domain-containing protein [Clostridia bacterium]